MPTGSLPLVIIVIAAIVVFIVLARPDLCARREPCTPPDPCEPIADGCDPAALTLEATMTVRRHVHHVHSGWPVPYTGVIAAILFGVAIFGGFTMLLWLTR